MNIIEIMYKDKIVQVRQVDGKFEIKLPNSPDEKRGVCKTVYADGMSWMFHSTNTEEIEDFFCVWLNRDGSIQYENNSTGEIEKAEFKFNPNMDNSEFPYNVAQELYDLGNQLQYVLRIKEEIKGVRRKRLDLMLQKLGYSSPEEALTPLRDYASTCDLNEIAEDLENYEDLIIIDGFSRRQGADIVYRIPSQEDKSQIIEFLKRIVAEVDKEVASLDDEREMLARKRNLIDDFGEGIPGLVSRTDREWAEFCRYTYRDAKEFLAADGIVTDEPEGKPNQSLVLHNTVWKRYTEQIMAIAKLYLGLNVDLLEPEVAKQVEDLTGLRTLYLQDRVANLTDSYRFDEASNTENIIVTAINLGFIRKAESILGSDDQVRDSGVGRSLMELQTDSREKIADRLSHIEKYKDKQDKIKKMKNATAITIAYHPEKNDGESR